MPSYRRYSGFVRQSHFDPPLVILCVFWQELRETECDEDRCSVAAEPAQSLDFEADQLWCIFALLDARALIQCAEVKLVRPDGQAERLYSVAGEHRVECICSLYPPMGGQDEGRIRRV